MNKKDFRFFEPLRVRWAEVDMQKIVFNAHYLMYFDTAISGYWRALAMPYEETMHALGGDLYVKKAGLEYQGSARFDDQLQVGLRCARIGSSSMVFEGAIFRASELLVTGELVYVFADPATQKSRPVPPVLRQVLEDFEKGEAMYSVRLGNWAELGKDAAAVRTEVFVEEQHVPLDMEWDEEDATAVHALANNAFGRPIGTGRLLQGQDGTAKIGRMAVNRLLRGTHIGSEILHALMDAAKARGDTEICLHAQCSAQDFYASEGFTPVGEPFDDVDIPHIEMRKQL